MMRCLDTNILVYAVGTAIEDMGKRRRARDLLTARNLVLSVQVLPEFYGQSTRVSRPGALTHDEAVAFAIRERFGLSYWGTAPSLLRCTPTAAMPCTRKI